MKLTALMTLFFSGFLYSILAMGNSMSTHNADFFRKANLDPSADLLADPKFRLLLDQFREHMKAISHLPLSEQRRIDAELALNNNKCRESVNRIENLEILGAEKNKISLRIYIPNETQNLPVMMYFHGGGWVFGGIDDADAVCRRLANHMGCVIASVEYRLAPEFPFPKPLEDCYAATEWMVDHAHLFGGDSGNIIVSGESAGGNLAAAVALMARDKQGPKLSAQLLLYPVISSHIQDDIYDQCPDHYFITKDVMRYFWKAYAQNPGDDKNPYASLDCVQDFNHLPPALIVTAEYDPLSFDGDRYAMQLQEASVPVIKKSFSKLIHGFLYIPLYEENQKIQWTKEIRTSLCELGVLY